MAHVPPLRHYLKPVAWGWHRNSRVLVSWVEASVWGPIGSPITHRWSSHRHRESVRCGRRSDNWSNRPVCRWRGGDGPSQSLGPSLSALPPDLSASRDSTEGGTLWSRDMHVQTSLLPLCGRTGSFMRTRSWPCSWRGLSLSRCRGVRCGIGRHRPSPYLPHPDGAGSKWRPFISFSLFFPFGFSHPSVMFFGLTLFGTSHFA